jgi:hypothetical protein
MHQQCEADRQDQGWHEIVEPTDECSRAPERKMGLDRVSHVFDHVIDNDGLERLRLEADSA